MAAQESMTWKASNIRKNNVQDVHRRVIIQETSARSQDKTLKRMVDGTSLQN